MMGNFGPLIVTTEQQTSVVNHGPITPAILQQRFVQYNTKYFQGKLPQVQIKFSNLPGETAGLTSYTVYEKNGKKIIDPKSIIISINNMFKSPNVHYGKDGGVNTILLHEMSHVFMGKLGHTDEKHGQRFQSWLRRLSPATGYTYEDLMGKQQAAEHEDMERLLELSGIRS